MTKKRLKQIGIELARARLEIGTQKDVAELTGLGLRTLQRLEHGDPRSWGRAANVVLLREMGLISARIAEEVIG